MNGLNLIDAQKSFPSFSEKQAKEIAVALSKIAEEAEKSQLAKLATKEDFTEGEYVSHWRWQRRKRPTLEYQLPLIDKEADEVHYHMDRIDKALGKVGCKKK